MKAFLLTLLLGAFSFGADVAGVWRGTFTPQRPDGTLDDEKSVYLLIKQEGSKLTGKIGPDEEKNWEYTKGKIDGDSISIELFGDGMNLKVALTLKDGGLEGVVNAEKDDEKKRALLKLRKT